MVVKKTAAIAFTATLAAAAGTLVIPATVDAADFSPMKMMNPSKWFGGKNRDDDYYYDGPPPGAYGPAPGYGPPPYGYGAPAAGYGPAPYGAPGGYPQVQGYGAAPGAAATPSPNGDAQQRIQELEERIRQLESMQQYSAPPAAGSGYGMQQPAAPTGYGMQQPAQPSTMPGYGLPPASQPSAMPGYGGAMQQPGPPVFRPSN